MMPGLEKEGDTTSSRLAAQLPNNLAANIAYLVIKVIIVLVLALLVSLPSPLFRSLVEDAAFAPRFLPLLRAVSFLFPQR